MGLLMGPRRLLRRAYPYGNKEPGLRALTGDSGIANLSPYLTINSVTKSPTLMYYGNDATATTFPAQWGSDLAIAGSGTAPSLNQPAYGNGVNDYMVKGAGGEYYSVAAGTAEIGTDDFVMEFCFYFDDTAAVNEIFMGNRVTNGWDFRTSATQPIIVLSDTVPVNKTILGPAMTDGTFVHIMVFGDMSGSCMITVNGVGGTPVDISALGDVTGGNPLLLFAGDGGSNPSVSGLISVAMWKGAAWLDTHLQAAVALERFQKWSGIYPTKASGTAAPAYSRACSAYATKWNGTSYDLINCSAGLPRVDYVLDDSGTPFKGMLIEPQATNLVTYSNDLATGWTDSAMATTESTIASPDGSINMYKLVGDASTGAHTVYAPFTAGTGAYCLSMIIYPGDRDWLRFRDDQGNSQWIDVNTGTLGVTTGTISASGAYSMGGGFLLVWFVATYTPATINVTIQPCDSDGGANYTGDNSTPSIYCSFAQVELGNKPTSRIYTAGATATRLADDLQYNGDNVAAGQGTIKAEMLVDAHTPAAELSIAALSDGGSTDEMIRSYVDTGTQVPIFNAVDSTVAQWTITGSTDVVDGDIHTVKLPYETNDAKQYVDNALDGTPDTSCTVPTALDEIDIGQDTASANQLNGRIRNVEIWPWVEENL